MVGVPFEVSTHGLSVTPNILHGDLATQTLAHFQNGSIDPVTTLGIEVIRRLGTIPWTEYSLYTSVAELNGNLFDYHIHWDPAYFSDTQLVSEKSCVWDRDDFERLTKLRKGSDPGGKFIIVQSHARIPVEQVREVLHQLLRPDGRGISPPAPGCVFGAERRRHHSASSPTRPLRNAMTMNDEDGALKSPARTRRSRPGSSAW